MDVGYGDGDEEGEGGKEERIFDVGDSDEEDADAAGNKRR